MACPRPVHPAPARWGDREQNDGSAGGIGAKKVDVTWATEESGLLLGISVKTISFRDRATRNFQKNLTNRRGDMLIEAVTLHRRFPYAVLMGLLFLDKDARTDGTPKRRSTFDNAFPRLRLFTGRSDPAGRDEQFERLYLLLVDANPFNPAVEAYHVSDPSTPVALDDMMREAIELVAERNFDLYEEDKAGNIRKVYGRRRWPAASVAMPGPGVVQPEIRKAAS